jgi:hypothetical protein
MTKYIFDKALGKICVKLVTEGGWGYGAHNLNWFRRPTTLIETNLPIATLIDFGRHNLNVHYNLNR